jgi:hypothetical protein
MILADLPTLLRNKIKVISTGCWIWTGCIVESRRGQYGKVQWKRKTWRAHRLLFFLNGGELKLPATRWHVDHLCNETLCVNPAHLQLLYYWDNLAKSGGRGAAGMRRKDAPPHVRDAYLRATDPTHCD